MNTTISATITLGLESPAISENAAREFYLGAAARCFPDGHRITEGTGRWLSPERGVVDEPCLTVHVICPNLERVRHFAEYCKAGAQQDSVLVEISRPEVLWI